ncbi:response regulator [Paludibaculum fermentans]|uniref:Response regulator n=1 Tax=Paludibaculum fermentans TaxID=1473598 RepID=A0A7S7NYD5_PALFE|nr:response regulator [Paludibaculum fermentans]QOY92068.1 response regulator [Paludibaculum fermentans]
METAIPGPAKILVVDDDAAVREVVATMLRTAGYAVSLAANGREALLSLQREQFRVIITDLVMPEQEGIETIKVIRRDYPEVRVIAMSGAFGGDYLRIAGYLGAHGTLAKPLQLSTVLKAVSDALAATN